MRRNSSGNPDLAARLKGMSEADLSEFCTAILRRHGAAEGEAMIDRGQRIRRTANLAAA